VRKRSDVGVRFYVTEILHVKGNAAASPANNIGVQDEGVKLN